MSSSLFPQNTFLEHFLKSGDPFGIIQDRLFVLEHVQDGEDPEHYFSFLGNQYALSESEEISQLESFYFDDQQTNIETMMTQHIQKKYIDVIHSKKNTINRLTNVFQSMQDFSVEQFILNDVFHAYYRERPLPPDVPQFEEVFEFQGMPSLRNVTLPLCSFSSLIQNKNIIVIGNQSYALTSPKYATNGIVYFQREQYGLEPFVDLFTLTATYQKQLLSRMVQAADIHSAELSKTIAKLQKRETQLHQFAGQTSQRSMMRRGELELRKLTHNSYELSVHIDPFIIEKNQRYYCFGSVQVGSVLRATHSTVSIENDPEVLSAPYVHPFVWDDGKICYGSYSWKNEIGIDFNYPYPIQTQKRVAAKKISEVMHKAKRILEQGYVGSHIKPVRTINNCNTYIGNQRSQAEQYAHSHNIPLTRIIKNE